MVTSWFWLVGIVVLSLLPPLIKELDRRQRRHRHGLSWRCSQSPSAAGSWLAAAIARGRIVLGTTVAGAVLLGIFALDLGIGVWNTPADIALRGPTEIFAAFIGLRAAFDLAGLAVGGGLFIVPAFAAVQAWSHADHRARNVAAVNVLNAAFMTGGDGGVRAAAAIRRERAGAVSDRSAWRRSPSASAIWRTMPRA